MKARSVYLPSAAASPKDRTKQRMTARNSARSRNRPFACRWRIPDGRFPYPASGLHGPQKFYDPQTKTSGGSRMSSTVASAVDARRSRVPLLIVTLLFLVTTVNYAGRAPLSIAGTALAKDLSLDPVAMGYIFSAFGWSSVAAQG